MSQWTPNDPPLICTCGHTILQHLNRFGGCAVVGCSCTLFGRGNTSVPPSPPGDATATPIRRREIIGDDEGARSKRKAWHTVAERQGMTPDERNRLLHEPAVIGLLEKAVRADELAAQIAADARDTRKLLDDIMDEAVSDAGSDDPQLHPLNFGLLSRINAMRAALAAKTQTPNTESE